MSPVRRWKGIGCLAALGVLLACADARSTEMRLWEDVATRALMEELRRTHLDVAEWEVRPLIGKRQSEKLSNVLSADVQVTRTGPRSAVIIRTPERSTSTTVWFAVRAMRDVVVAHHGSRLGQGLTSSDGLLARRDVMPLGCEPLASTRELSEMRARVALRANSVVCTEHIEPRPAVARGERVIVHSSFGRVRVSGSAIAEQDGRVGDTLKVRHPKSQARYLAEVTGRDEVRVNESH